MYVYKDTHTNTYKGFKLKTRVIDFEFLFHFFCFVAIVLNFLSIVDTQCYIHFSI